jgi:DNA (cytosine-5)-methyltransferase 3A
MNVLSLFDGISCGRLALERAGITVDNYYSSEINKYAISIANKHFPQDIPNRLGSVTTIDSASLPKIDLLIGGSPCQNFSFIGKRQGAMTAENIEVTSLEHYLQLKSDNVVFNGESYLLWEYVRLLRELKPRYFLLENVTMPRKWKSVITDVLGVEPILINSSLVSAQNRRRLYWTNIPNITQPDDLHLTLKDIIQSENEIESQYYLSQQIYNTFLVRTVRCNSKGLSFTVGNPEDKARPILTKCGESLTDTFIKTERVDSVKGTQHRKFTCIEMERLQTLPDNYTEGISKTQRRKAIGNCWTVDVIAHILRHIPQYP